MIQGIGVDTVETARIALSFERFGNKFLSRIGHPLEIEKSPRISHKGRFIEFWAARYAAKEAFAKALGTGIGKNLSLKEVGVVRARGGKPELVFAEKVKKKLETSGVLGCHIALTHTKTLATAVVVIEGTLRK
ncbi:MAG: holo-ACP synthase [Bdellovibrionota bacterium]